MPIKKRFMLLSTASVLAFVLAIGGATYALFTSSATNTGNNFTAGTINLVQDRDQGDTIPGPMFYSAASDPSGSFPYDTNKNVPYQPPGGEALGGWAPGDSATRAMNITNTGSLTAVVTKLKATVNTNGTSSGDAYNEFIDKMNILVLYPATNKVLYNGKLAGLLNGWVDMPGLLANANGGAINITFTATLDKQANNSLQGHKDFIFDFSFYAEQK
ncbi:MAG: SipW-dependent-type signal peptide-containing protein [Carboxydocellales bacterium]